MEVVKGKVMEMRKSGSGERKKEEKQKEKKWYKISKYNPFKYKDR
jgi:hypothetical protein